MKLPLRKQLKNERGSALAWAAIALLVLLVFVTGVLGVAGSYHRRSVNNNARSQAYFTARSAVNAAVQELSSTGSSLLSRAPEGERVDLPVGGLPPSMGGCTVSLLRHGNELFVEATAAQGGQRSTVAARLEKQTDFVTTPGGFATTILGDAEDLDGFITNGSIYLRGDEPAVLRSTSGCPLQIDGTVYSEGPVTVTGNERAPYIAGSIISLGDVGIYDTNTPVGGSQNVNGCAIYSAGDVTIQSYNVANITGDITAAGTIEIQSNSSNTVTGNLRADTVILSGTIGIQGNITANTIIIDHARGNFTPYTVDGNISAGRIEFRNTWATTVHGQVTANALFIRGEPVMQEGSTVSNTVSGYIHLPVEPLPAVKVPAPTLPDLSYTGIPRPEDTLLEPVTDPGGGNAGLILGDFDPEDEVPDAFPDRYYLLTEDFDRGNPTITVRGSGNVYLIVGPDVDLDVSKIQYQATADEPPITDPDVPRLFIRLEDGAELNFKGQSWSTDVFYCYVDGKDGGEVNFQHDHIEIYGGVHAAGFDAKLATSVFYIDPKDGSAGGVGGIVESWVLTKYLARIPEGTEVSP